MSEDKKNELDNGINEQSIDEILKSFQAQKESRNYNSDKLDMPPAPIKSERQMLDFSAPVQEEEKPAKIKHKKEKKLKKEKPERQKKPKKEKISKDIKKDISGAIKKLLEKINIKKVIKPLVIAIVIVAVALGAVFGIKAAVTYSKTAYLKPYQQKYPDVKFPDGILEKYCDAYGEAPDAAGYIKISELNINTPVMPKTKKAYPMAEKNTSGSVQKNYVIYFDDNSLEQYYKDATCYNQLASGFVEYTDFLNEYNFKIVGAFYTNTKAEDDAGYIFPYNVTEEMTEKSTKAFIDRLSSRFIYDTGLTITRADTLLTISCPTDYRDNFRFVVVGVLRDDDEKLVATEKSKIRYPQVIYDENGQTNPYRFASKWYPEIIVRSKTKTQSIKDYE